MDPRKFISVFDFNYRDEKGCFFLDPFLKAKQSGEKSTH